MRFTMRFFTWCGNIELVSTIINIYGHIRLYSHKFKLFISGEALFFQDGELFDFASMFTLDTEQARQSVKKFLDYDIEKIICYHGDVYESDIKATL